MTRAGVRIILSLLVGVYIGTIIRIHSPVIYTYPIDNTLPDNTHASHDTVSHDNTIRIANKTHGYSYDAQTVSEPEGHRLLFMAPVYGMTQFIFLQKTLDCMLDICNMGWNVTVMLQAAKGFSQNHGRYIEIKNRAYCHRARSFIPIYVDVFSDNIGFGLNKQHRSVMTKHLYDFDYFVFAEEDMLLSASHLQAYIQAEHRLRKAMPSQWLQYTIGFLRYEESVGGDSERVTWEYRPHMVHVVDVDPGLGKYIVTNNLNQAIFIFSQEQVVDLQRRCHFLTDIGRNAFYNELRWALDQNWRFLAVGVSEWSSSFQHVLQCGLRRVIPVDHFQSHMILHSSNKAQNRRPRSELLNMRDWMLLIRNKSKTPLTVEEAYEVIHEQYNMHLMRPEKYIGKSLFSWNVSERAKSSIH